MKLVAAGRDGWAVSTKGPLAASAADDVPSEWQALPHPEVVSRPRRPILFCPIRPKFIDTFGPGPKISDFAGIVQELCEVFGHFGEYFSEHRLVFSRQYTRLFCLGPSTHSKKCLKKSNSDPLRRRG